MLHFKPTPQPTVVATAPVKKKQPVYLVKKHRINPDGTIALDLEFTWDTDKMNNESAGF